ncbi:MAG: nuclear transport factor 2 family protein [Gammaproteobacteria bacterium]|nr:nuclear transport factor 2 family protein [Gammaproteobacteria bacterium]
MTHEEGKKFVEKLFHAWKNGLIDQYDSLYHPNVSARLNQTIPLSYEHINKRFHYVSTSNVDREFKIEDLVVEGDKIMVFFCYSAYDNHLQEAINAPTMWLLTLDQGKIAKAEILTSLQFNYLEKT